MTPNEQYRKKLTRRKYSGLALAVLGIVLFFLGAWLMFAALGDPARKRACQLFSVLGGVFLAQGCSRFSKTCRLLKGPAAELTESRIAEEDEREQLLTHLGNTAGANIFFVGAVAAMVVSLFFNELTVFWTCYALAALQVVAAEIAKAWYRRRL